MLPMKSWKNVTFALWLAPAVLSILLPCLRLRWSRQFEWLVKFISPQVAARGVPVAEFNMEHTPATSNFGYHFHGPCGQTLPEAIAPWTLKNSRKQGKPRQYPGCQFNCLSCNLINSYNKMEQFGYKIHVTFSGTSWILQDRWTRIILQLYMCF